MFMPCLHNVTPLLYLLLSLWVSVRRRQKLHCVQGKELVYTTINFACRFRHLGISCVHKACEGERFEGTTICINENVTIDAFCRLYHILILWGYILAR